MKHQPQATGGRLGMNQLRGGYTLHTETLPTMPSMARVNGRGLWRATFRPNICLAPLEWGGVVAEQGDRYQCPSATCSCQAGRCYRLSQLSVKGERSAVTPWVSLIGRVCRSASLPLTLILYHTLRQKSIGFEKFFMNFLYFLYEQIMNCGIGIYGAPFKQL